MPSKPNKIQEKLEEAQRIRDRAMCLDIEVGLHERLNTLRLPEFEEKTMLEVAAHQLGIVLVETPTTGQQVR